MSSAGMEAAEASQAWLTQFEAVAKRGGTASLRALFCDESYWRDALALTWDLASFQDAGRFTHQLGSSVRETGAHGFRVDPGRTAPRRVTRAGQPVIESLFRFETRMGSASGVLRLREEGPDGVSSAWTLFTSLESLTGHEERIGARRPTGQSHSRDFHGPNWQDLRRADAAYASRDPAVLVVGGGQAGLAIAARLTVMGVDTLVVEREARVGDNWRNRYHALVLHNQVHVNHLPYLPFPPNWPVYIPKDKLAGWFEAYAEAMELNVWCATEFLGGSYGESEGCWSVKVRSADGAERKLRPRHVVMATGASGMANLPEIPSLAQFRGTVVHSSRYGDGEPWAGKRALVIGSGNSAHDIAQDLHGSGAEVTLVQRSPTLVASIEPSGQLGYALYDEGPPTEDCDLLAASVPHVLGRRVHRMLSARSRELDRELLAGLARIGFETDSGEDDTGWQYKYLTRGGGYYFNVGCSELLISGKVGLLHWRDISGFEAAGVRLQDGTPRALDLVVLATGYLGQEALVGRLFGEDVAARVGPVWGFDEKDELRNMYTRTPQPGLWFIAGSLAQCRINSKYLALQIKACEAGLLSPARRPRTATENDA